MNNLQIFDSPDFGQIRTIQQNGEPWFVGKDVADILGYQNGSRDVNRHVTVSRRCSRNTFRWPPSPRPIMKTAPA